MGRNRPRERPARDDGVPAGGTETDHGGKAARARRAGSREKHIIDALEQLREQLLAVPLGPSDGFRGHLRERLTASPPSPPTPRADRARPRRP